MSRTVLTRGHMIVLKRTPAALDLIMDDERKDKLCDDFNLSVNYQGTILFSEQDSDEGNEYGLTYLNGAKGTDAAEFMETVEKAGLSDLVVLGSIVPYSSLWYNGSDSYQSDEMLDSFMEANAKTFADHVVEEITKEYPDGFSD